MYMSYPHHPPCVLPSVVDCGNPGLPQNGRRSLSSTTFGSSVTFECNSGYKLEGQSSRQCQASGSWSGSVPQCVCKLLLLLLLLFVLIFILCNYQKHNVLSLYTWTTHTVKSLIKTLQIRDMI